MSLHVFGAIVTDRGCAANNRGETDGNITTLQKLLWNGEVHTTVSAEAIRWALRYYWQMNGKKEEKLNRTWSDKDNDNHFTDPDFMAWHPTAPKGEPFLDDDMFGFMDAAAGTEESENQMEIPRRIAELTAKAEKNPQDSKAAKALADFNGAVGALREARKKLRAAEEANDEKVQGAIEKEIQKLRKKAGLKSLAVARRGVLEITRAVSTIPFAGDISFNARSGEKGRTSLYGAEMHATRYQYGFAMTPERLRIQGRCLDALEGIVSLGEVAGNHSRFLFDFSPESVVIRISQDPAPRILYCFEEKDGLIQAPDLIRKVNNKDIDPGELFIGGRIAELSDVKKLATAACEPGVKAALNKAKEKLSSSLKQDER